MPATVLEIGQKACVRLGLGRPGAFIGSSDETMQQIAEAIEQAAIYCWDRELFEIAVEKIELELLGQEDQGELAELIPDLNYIMLDRAMYETDAGMTPADVTIRGGRLYVSPAPTAGEILVVYYTTKAWAITPDGSPTSLITSDSDIILLDRELMILATVAQWRTNKRLSAEPDIAARETRLAQLLLRDGLKPVLVQDKGALERLNPYTIVNVVGAVQS